jgi:hypothetical protein
MKILFVKVGRILGLQKVEGALAISCLSGIHNAKFEMQACQGVCQGRSNHALLTTIVAFLI